MRISRIMKRATSQVISFACFLALPRQKEDSQQDNPDMHCCVLKMLIVVNEE
jgi:hypothetical protein